MGWELDVILKASISEGGWRKPWRRDWHRFICKTAVKQEVNSCSCGTKSNCFCRNVSKDVADVTSSGRPFTNPGTCSCGKWTVRTVARRDGRTSSGLEVDDRTRPLVHRHISDIAQFFSEIAGCCAVQSSVDKDCQFTLSVDYVYVDVVFAGLIADWAGYAEAEWRPAFSWSSALQVCLVWYGASSSRFMLLFVCQATR